MLAREDPENHFPDTERNTDQKPQKRVITGSVNQIKRLADECHKQCYCDWNKQLMENNRSNTLRIHKLPPFNGKRAGLKSSHFFKNCGLMNKNGCHTCYAGIQS